MLVLYFLLINACNHYRRSNMCLNTLTINGFQTKLMELKFIYSNSIFFIILKMKYVNVYCIEPTIILL